MANADPSKKPLVTLYLPNVKARSSMVYGRSGKRYQFTANGIANGRPARIYFDASTFESEEKDIRANLKQLLAVCTLTGEGDPMDRAKSAIEGVSGNARAVGLGGVRQGLLELQTLIAAKLLELDGQLAPADSEPEAAPETIHTQELVEHDSNPTIPDDRSKYAETTFSESQLLTIGIHQLREIARAKRIEKMPRSRTDLVAAVLAKQAAAR